LETGRTITDVGAHSLRHTFVTIARMAGIPDPMIMQITGHSSQEMVDHYTQFSGEMVATLAGNLLGNAAGKKKALPFSEITKDSIPPWAKEKLSELRDLAAKITGKKNEPVKERIFDILKELGDEKNEEKPLPPPKAQPVPEAAPKPKAKAKAKPKTMAKPAAGEVDDYFKEQGVF
jgi:hypothetical protein